VSRGRFRATVEERPASAWVLVTVASAMLWITEQLQAWVIVVQVAAILLSLGRRKNPFRWQGSPITLNIGMFGIAGSTIVLALDGNPSTVSLAHFASLAQGLQLLDSRPRKSEFLLVTLSLFQVILASNLTDSLLFPPLLIVFVFSAVWTLMIHTLRSEAIEAGDGGAAAGAITPGLRRMTVVASTCAIVLALVLFGLLPRMRTSMLQTGLGRSQAMAGFSDQVELGTIGRIRKDRTVVLRVETVEGVAPDPRDAYWRGLAFDSFDGRRWAITPTHRQPRPGSVKFGIPMGGGSERADLTQVVVREPVAGGVIFGAGMPRHVSGALFRIEADVNGGLYDPLQSDQRVRYTIETESNGAHDRDLSRDRAAPPIDLGGRYLAMPDFASELRNLAEMVTEDETSDAERAQALETWLRSNGRYTDTPPPMHKLEDRSPVEEFLLGELEGHCEYFASGMVVLARSIDLPARLVNGFAGGRENPLGGFVELSRSDAHAWVEIHYEDAGWVRYDPTPPDLRLQSIFPLSLTEHLAALGSTIELWWFQRIVDFDSSDQIRALKSAFATWQKLRTPSNEPGREKTNVFAGFRLEDATGKLIIGGCVVLGLSGLLLHRTRRRRSTRGLPESYARALALLARRGLVRSRRHTARGFAAEVRGATPEEAGVAFGAITESYLAERFGARPEADARPSLERLRVSLAARTPTAR
jgi:transglutaminase-like putative cysteine protease